jgi:hypothetical protein
MVFFTFMKLAFKPAPGDERQNKAEALQFPPGPQGLRIR